MCWGRMCMSGSADAGEGGLGGGLDEFGAILAD